MALDPNQPQIGSWGLGALGTPLGAPTASTMPLAPPSTLTPQQVALMRQHAMALQEPPQEGIHHWTQGLAELVRAIQGNREADFARQAEATGRQQGAEAISSLYKPYLSQDGTPSVAGPAPVGQRGSGPAGATPSSDDQSSPMPPPTITAGNNSHDPRGMEPYIRETATKYGVDPEVAVKVAKAEGLRDFYGDGGKSGGAFQLYTGGGMGNDFQKETGLDPLDPKNEKATIDYALKNVPRVGWTPFHGARKSGIGEREGISAKPRTADATPVGLFSQPPEPTAFANEDTAPAGLPPEISQGASAPRTPPAAVPSRPAAPNMAPMIDAIAGRPIPPIAAAGTPPGPLPAPGGPIAPADFARAAAAMEAAKGPPVFLPSVPINQPPPGIPPADFAKAAAAMEAAKGPPVPFPSGPIPPAIPPDVFAKAAADMEAAKTAPQAPATPATPAPANAAALPSPIPLPAPRPPMPLPFGSAVPGAVGPTSVGGAPLVPPRPPLALPPPFGPTSVNGSQLPQPGGIPPATLVNAIAGRPMAAAPGAPAAPAGGGAPSPMAPIQVAQTGQPTGGPPMAAGGPPGLPQPLTSPIGQINPAQLTQMLANPWVPDSAKAAMLQMIQQRAQPQSMPVEGGTLMFDAAGRKVFIPEPKMGTIKIGGAEIPTVSHFDPATGRWNTTTLAPGGGVQTGASLPATGGATGGTLPHPAGPQTATEPDLSSIGGIQAAEAAQAGAKKAAEAGGEASAKYYDSLHKGLAGSAMIAAQQKQNIDMLRQVAATPDFTPGAGSEAALGLQRLAAQFGINPEGAAPREIFNQVATRILADQISGIKSMASETGETGGRIFKSMLDLEEKANITPEDTPAGINAKLNLIDAAGNLMMKWGNMADDYVAEHGKLDPGFDKTLRKEISEARIPNIVPRSEERKPSGEPAAPISGPQTGPPKADTIRQNGVLFKRQPDGSYQAVQ